MRPHICRLTAAVISAAISAAVSDALETAPPVEALHAQLAGQTLARQAVSIEMGVQQTALDPDD